MEEDCDVIFEGSELHKYLESLDILENEEVHQRISTNFTNKKIAENNCDEWGKFYFSGIISIIKNTVSLFVEWITQEEKYNTRLTEFIGTHLCCKNALTIDDRLYLYHFSPTFARIVEKEVTLSTDEFPFRLKLLTLSTFISFVPLSYLGFSLPASVFLLPSCLITIRFLNWKSKRSVQECVERLLNLLTEVERKCLPHTISAATEVSILSTGSHFTEESTLHKVNSQCDELLKMTSIALQKALTIFETCGIYGEHMNIQSWSDVKEGKTLIKILLSRLSMELMMQCDGTMENTTNNILKSVHKICIRQSQMLDNLEYQNSLVYRQINLMKQSWFVPRLVNSNPRKYCEEEKSLKSMQLHAKQMIILIDSYEQSFGDENETEVEKYELLNENISKIDAEVAAIKEDCDVLHEIANQILQKRIIKESETLKHPVKTDTKHEDLPEIQPHVPQDEFLEGDPIADFNPSDDPWFEELTKEDESRKLLRVQNKRVLSELQPILTRKKLEFDKREKIAKGIDVTSGNVEKSEDEVIAEMNSSDSKMQFTEAHPLYYYFQTHKEKTTVFAVIDCERKIIIVPLIRVDENIVTSSLSKNESISNQLCLSVFTVNNIDSIQYPINLKDESIHTSASLESVSLLLENNQSFNRCSNISSELVNEVCSLFLEQFNIVSEFEVLPHKNNIIIYYKRPFKSSNKNEGIGENRSRIYESGSNDSNSVHEEGEWTDKNLTLHERLQKSYLNSAAEEGEDNQLRAIGGLHFCSELASLAASKAKSGFNNSTGLNLVQTGSEDVFGSDGDSESE